MENVVCSFQPDFKLIYVNAACCRYFGKASSQLIGADIRELISGADRETFQQRIASLSSENPITTFEQKNATSGGGVSWRQWHHLAVFDSQGRISTYQTMFTDTEDSADSSSRLSEKLPAISSKLFLAHR